MPRSRPETPASRPRKSGQPRRRMSEFLLVVIAVGALIVVQVGASTIASYVALRDARVGERRPLRLRLHGDGRARLHVREPRTGARGHASGALGRDSLGLRAGRPTTGKPPGNDAALAGRRPGVHRAGLRAADASESSDHERHGGLRRRLREVGGARAGDGYEFTERDASGQTSKGAARARRLRRPRRRPRRPRRRPAATPSGTGRRPRRATPSGSSPRSRTSRASPWSGLRSGRSTPTGRSSAVVLVEIDVQALSNYLTGLPLGGDGEAFILSQERHLVAAPSRTATRSPSAERATGQAPDAGVIGVMCAAGRGRGNGRRRRHAPHARDALRRHDARALDAPTARGHGRVVPGAERVPAHAHRVLRRRRAAHARVGRSSSLGCAARCSACASTRPRTRSRGSPTGGSSCRGARRSSTRPSRRGSGSSW